MKIHHHITYTVAGGHGPEIREQGETTLVRTKPLTHAGAQRILRRSHPGAIVTHIKQSILK